MSTEVMMNGMKMSDTEKTPVIQKQKVFLNDNGWALWEILSSIAIVAFMGLAVMGLSSSTSSSNQSTTALQEAEALQAEVQNMYPNRNYVASGDISSTIVTQQAAPANMLTGGCATGLCGPFSGSSFSVVPNGTTFSITLTPVTQQQCAAVLESASGSGLWVSINGIPMSVSSGGTGSISPQQANSSCGSGQIQWVSQ